jgi:hypothetical protein
MGNTGIFRNALAQFDTSTGLMTGTFSIDGTLYVVPLASVGGLQIPYNTATAQSHDKIWVAFNCQTEVAQALILNSGVVFSGSVPGTNAQMVFETSSSSSVGAIL